MKRAAQLTPIRFTRHRHHHRRQSTEPITAQYMSLPAIMNGVTMNGAMHTGFRSAHADVSGAH
jgi:hypothetical protein